MLELATRTIIFFVLANRRSKPLGNSMRSLKLESIEGALLAVCYSLVLSDVTTSVTGPIYFRRNGPDLFSNGTTPPERCRITNQLSYPMSAHCNWTYDINTAIKMYGDHRYVSYSSKSYGLYRDPNEDHFLLLILYPKTFDDDTRFACTYYVLRNPSKKCFWTTPCEIQAQRNTNVTCSRNDINYLTKKISISTNARVSLHERYDYTTIQTTTFEGEARTDRDRHAIPPEMPPSPDSTVAAEETSERKHYTASTSETSSTLRSHSVGTMELQTPHRVYIDTNSTNATTPRIPTNATTSGNEQKNHSNVVIAWAYTILLTAPFFAAIYVTLLVITTNRRRRRRYGRMEINPSTEHASGTTGKTLEIRKYVTTL